MYSQQGQVNLLIFLNNEKYSYPKFSLSKLPNLHSWREFLTNIVSFFDLKVSLEIFKIKNEYAYFYKMGKNSLNSRYCDFYKQIYTLY